MISNFEADVVIEISKGSAYKYEADKVTGTLKIDRPLNTPIPYNYGFIPHTLHDDGDPLDVCLIDNDFIAPLCSAKVTIIGAFICKDNGKSDDKLLAIVKGNETKYEKIQFWDEDTQESFIETQKATIKKYLSTYKEGFVVEKFVCAEDAMKILEEDRKAYTEGYWNPNHE